MSDRIAAGAATFAGAVLVAFGVMASTMEGDVTRLLALVERALAMADGMGAYEAALRLDQARLSLMGADAAADEARRLIEDLARIEREGDTKPQVEAGPGSS